MVRDQEGFTVPASHEAKGIVDIFPCKTDESTGNRMISHHLSHAVVGQPDHYTVQYVSH